MVSISVERLQKLEELEEKVKANKRKYLDKLLQKIAESPVPIHVPKSKPSTERVLRHIANNREAYNQRRRERRRMQKEAAAAAAAAAQAQAQAQAPPENPPGQSNPSDPPVQPSNIKPQP